MASPPLIRNGISYVTARAAAPGAGISADYITKLCRRGEVNAVVVGTTWYVDEASLADFVARTKAAKKAQAELNAQQLKEVARRAQAAEQQPQQHPSISLAQQLLNDKAARVAAFAHREAKYRLPRPNAIALATITLLVATSAAALGSDTLRAHMATAGQFPHRLAAAAATAAASATSLAQQLPALEFPQLPSAKPAQLAQAQTSLAQTLTQKIRNFFCRFISGCATGSLAAGTPPTSANSGTTSRILDRNASNTGGQDHATKSENVNSAQSQPASTPQTSPSDIARSAPTTPVVGSSASASASPSAVAFETKPPPQPVHYITVSGVTQQLLESRLAQLESVLSARIQSASLASAYQSTRSSDNVGDNLRNLTDGYALAFDTNALSADAATLGALAITSNASIGDSLTVTNDASVGGDLTVAGTLTAGTLAVSGVSSGGAIEAPNFTATSTQATSTFAGGISALGPAQFANSANFFATTAFGATGTTTIATDGTISTPGISAQNATAASATLAALTSYSATAGALSATSSLSLPYLSSALLSTDSSGTFTATTSLASSYLAAIDKGFFFATTSADFWQTERNFFSTTSTDYWHSITDLFSTTSSAYFLSVNQGNAFSTSSASNFLSLNQGMAFSTSSADAWKDTRNFFSTTSTAYFVSVNQGSLFSTTSAIHFVHSSTTIPKTYTANAFTALQSFNAGLALPSLTNSLLATDGSGNVIATSTLASSLLSLPSGYTFRGNTSNLAEATSTLFVASSGNVGVGTTSPSQRLDVNGIIQTNNYFRSVRAETIGQPAFVDLNNSSGQSLTLKYAEEAISAIPADVWQFRIGGATRDILFSLFDSTPLLMIKGNGNVGIGTTTPDNKLNVQGNIFAGNTTDGVVIRESGNIGEVLGINSALNSFNDLYIRSNSASGIYLNTSGSVGIGTTTPSAKLEISDSLSQAVGATLTNTSTGTGALTRLFLRNDGSTGGGQLQVGGTGYTGIASWQDSLVLNSDSVLSGGIKIRAATGGIKLSASGTEANDFYINSSGSVGIGTTSPSARFEIGDNSTGGIQAFITNSNSATNSYAELTVRNDYNTFNNVGGLRLLTLGTGYTSSGIFNQDSAVVESGAALSGGLAIGTAASAPLSFFTGGTAVGNVRMTINSSGNVGIGTTSPNAVLDIRGAGGADVKLTRDTTGNYLYFRAPGGAPTGAGIGINGSEYLTILSTGNIGIGTTSPWRKLSVTGTVGFDGLSGSTGAGSLCLDANKQVVYNSASDSCLSSTRDTKTDINPLVTDALEQVLALNPVSFTYRQGDQRVRYGFIAEDAADVDPHLATYGAGANISGIDDRAILAILVKAIQDLAAKLTALADRFTTRELTFERAVGDELTLNKLCLGSVCVTEAEFMAVFGGGASQSASASAPPPPSNPSDQSPVSTTDSVSIPPSNPSNTAPQNATTSNNPDLTDSAQPPHANWTPEEPTNDAPSPEASNDNQPPTPADTTATFDAANDNPAPPVSEAI